MGFFDFLQNIGSLGQMVRNVAETYLQFKKQPAESDLERFVSLAVVRYLHQSAADRKVNMEKVIGNMLALIERGEPVGLYGYCIGVAWAEMDVDSSDVDSQKNILKIIRSSGVSYDDAYGKTYEVEELYSLLKKFNL